ncbi:MAG TPA: DUF808 domain-containing protein [Aliiroseovarius sp.]|nr:DUF808 domain-containing protein [Aliiroseovarius sp.]
MSGLLALLDDVASIAKVAAASVDDVATQALKAGAKAAGAVIDDAAVTPKYVQGFEASRELPIIGRIALGSLKNKLLFLLPVGLLLTTFAPWAIAPLLALGGGYLCFEGAEKVWHWLHNAPEDDSSVTYDDPAHLEEAKVAGAIKTDFILSAEIMTISLAAIPESSIWLEAATLAVVGIGITVVVYGSVALIVKADDLGLLMARKGRLRLGRRLGRGLVRIMPGFLAWLMVIGTAAMLWVGGSIVLHGLAEMDWGDPAHLVENWALAARAAVPEQVASVVEWSAAALMDGLFGVMLGFVLVALWSTGQRLFRR